MEGFHRRRFENLQQLRRRRQPSDNVLCVIIDHYFGFDISLGCATKISDKGCLTNMSEHGFDIFATAPKLAAKLLCASVCIGFRTREAEILSQ